MTELPPPPLANVITLGAHDMARQRAFYVDLGWPAVIDTEDFVVFELRGALLALFPRDKLADDARAEAAPATTGISTSVIIIVDRAEDVDEVAARAEAAGATLTKPPTDPEFFTGRHAYFADPEGHYWEITFSGDENPVTAAARRAAGG